jgi:hypothetical protein
MFTASPFEGDLYVGITVAWYRMRNHGLDISHAIRSYVLGDGFAKSVQDALSEVSFEQVIAICALVVSSKAWELAGLRKILDTQNIHRAPIEALDPVCAWWYPLGEPPDLGIHYWELGNGIIELRRLSRFVLPPGLQFGRLAAELGDDASPATSPQRGCYE